MGDTQPFLYMRTPRRNAAAVSITPNKIWIVGGRDRHHHVVKSTEYVTSASHGQGIVGPDLPKPLYGLCMANKNVVNIILTGGRDYGANTKETWIFDITNERWSLGPSMNEARTYHGCAALSSGIIIVAGGVGGKGTNSNSILRTVEVLYNDKWTYGNVFGF